MSKIVKRTLDFFELFERTRRPLSLSGVARELDLPIIVHAREADNDIADIIEDEMGKGTFRGVLHCFSSGPELARRAIDVGFYVSFSGILTFKSAAAIQQVAADSPEDRILVETDAPYLAPVPMRGKPNEPAYTSHTLSKPRLK